MASLVLSGDTSGSITIAAPAVAGSNTQTLVAATGTLAPLISGTAITLTNQTAPAFTDIPSWVKRITLMFSGVSTNGAGNYLIQLGTGATPTYTTSGYSSSADWGGSAVTSTAGFIFINSTGAAVHNGIATIALVNANTWAESGILRAPTAATGGVNTGAVTLGAALTAVRLYVDGTQQFDAGTVNILYE